MKNITEAFNYLKKMWDISLFSFPTVDLKPLLYIAILLVVEWVQRNKQHGLELNTLKVAPFRWIIYAFVFCLILFFGAKSESFIYFQF